MSGPSSVLVVHGGEGDSQRYRCVHAAQQLDLFGVPVEVVRFDDPAFREGASGYDLVLLHRIAADRTVAATIRRVRERGGVVVFDTDDLVFDPDVTGWI